MSAVSSQRIRVVDSHTGGEPTRVVIEGGPDLGSGDLAARSARFRQQFDEFRSCVVGEPRGSDAVVGALLCQPVDPSCACGVIFFNNVGTIGMCVHGTIGLAVTLAHLGRIGAGEQRIETPVGVVAFRLLDGNQVEVRNVRSFRAQKNVQLDVKDYGRVTGDVAWGGNWFFLVNGTTEKLCLTNVDRLTDVTWRIRQALVEQGIAGTDGAEIDHIELFGPPKASGADSKNFVLCPGKAYDRSPCGTGTSAKIACLVSDGKLLAGQVWRQESIVGSLFEGYASIDGDAIIPHIRGSAYVTAEATLIVDPRDPLRGGIRA